MGLDLTVLGRPKPAHEEEFRTLFLQLTRGSPPAKRSILDRLRGRKRPTTKELSARFQELCIPHYVTIGAPVVGTDTAADRWVHTAMSEGSLPQFETTEAALKNLGGYYALEAMTECDGFPAYTHAYAYDGVDRASFRGSFLQDCKDILPRDLIERPWASMLAEELSEWGHSVASASRDAAVSENASHVLGKHDIEDDFGSPARNIHIADSAARWAMYWSERGHGSEAYF